MYKAAVPELTDPVSSDTTTIVEPIQWFYRNTSQFLMWILNLEFEVK